MRLTELDPRWYTFATVTVGNRVILGVTFECPCCRTQRLGVAFNPPIDPLDQLAETGFHQEGWTRSGETFETLTLSPSVAADAHGHWHGHIVDGEIL